MVMKLAQIASTVALMMLGLAILAVFFWVVMPTS